MTSQITGNSSFFQRLVQANKKENMTVAHYLSFVSGIHDAKRFSIPSRYDDLNFDKFNIKMNMVKFYTSISRPF